MISRSAIVLLALSLAAPRAPSQSEPAGGEAPAKPAQAQPAPPAPQLQHRDVELRVESQFRFDGPLRGALDDERKAAELRLNFARAAKSLSRNVVRLSIERSAPGATQLQFEVSAFVLGPQGQVVTFGDAVDQASRVVVRFVNIPGERPRRAAILGVDPENGVGLLDVGPVNVPEVKLDATAPVELNAANRPVEAPPAGATTVQSRDPASRMVVSMWGVRGAENPIALGVMDGPQAMGGARLYRISVVRRPEASGGIVAGPDGRVVAMLLAPVGFVGQPDSQLQPMLALPASMLEAGVARVRARTAAAPNGAPVARPMTGARPRAWIGVGASDLAEPEFLRQIGRSGAVVVEEVFAESPALAAKIEPHDVLLSWNGKELHGVEDFSAALAASAPGATVQIDYLRGLKPQTAVVTLAAW